MRYVFSLKPKSTVPIDPLK